MESGGIKFLERALPVAERPAFSYDDLQFLLQLPLLLATALLPDRLWNRCCRVFEYPKALIDQKEIDDRAEIVRQNLSLEPHSSRPREIESAARANRLENTVQVLRERMPHRWRPTLKLEGADNLDRSISHGHGVVLWVAHFVFASLATKKIMAEHGYSVCHISRPEHGFSKSRFGIKWLNPIRCGAEDRYLDRRVLINRALPGNAFREALRILEAGGIVSTTAGAWEGRTVAEGDFLLSRLKLAIGAPNLALESGADLLPVFTTRILDRTIVTTIGAPINLQRTVPKNDAIAVAFQDYMSLLASAVARYPDQWRGWGKLTSAGASTA